MKTLLQMLATCQQEQLQQIAQLWEIQWSTTLSLAAFRQHIAAQAVSPLAVRFVWTRLSTEEQRLLFHACSPPFRSTGGEPDGLMHKARLDAATFSTALIRLTDLLLLQITTPSPQGSGLSRSRTDQTGSEGSVRRVIAVFPDYSPETLYAIGREVFAGAERSQLPLLKILNKLEHPSVFRLAQIYQIDMTSFSTVTDYRTILAEELLQPRVIYDRLGSIEPTLRSTFLWLQGREGWASMKSLQEQIGDSHSLMSHVESLQNHALAYSALTPQGEHILFVPRQIYTRVKQDEQVTPSASSSLAWIALPQIPDHIFQGCPAILHDLAVAIWAMHRLSVEVTKEGMVLKRIAVKLRPLMKGRGRRGEDREDIYLDLVFQSAEQMKLLDQKRTPRSGKMHYISGTNLEKWGQFDAYGEVQYFLNWWAQDSRYSQGPIWADIYPGPFVQWEETGWTPRKARGMTLAMLKECITEAWYSISSLLDLFWARNPYALHPYAGPNKAGYRPTLALKEKWMKCEGSVYRGVLFTLYELGMVDLAGDEVSNEPLRATAFRLTELGARALRSTDHHLIGAEGEEMNVLESPASSLIVQPNFDILILHPDFPALYALLPFTEIVQLDVAFHLKATRESVLRGVEHGLSARQMLLRLEERSQPKEIPQNVRHEIVEWARGYKETILSHVVLLEVDDETIADFLCRSPHLTEFNLRRIAPCAIVANLYQDTWELRKRILKMGVVIRIGDDQPKEVKREWEEQRENYLDGSV